MYPPTIRRRDQSNTRACPTRGLVFGAWQGGRNELHDGIATCPGEYQIASLDNARLDATPIASPHRDSGRSQPGLSLLTGIQPSASSWFSDVLKQDVGETRLRSTP